MNDYLQQSNQPPALNQLRQYTLISYIMYAASFVVGLTYFVGIVMNYLKRDEVRGTWLESHVEWQIKTFWYTLIGAIVGTILLFVLIGFVVLALVTLWFLYRVIKGLIVFLDNKPIGNGLF